MILPISKESGLKEQKAQGPEKKPTRSFKDLLKKNPPSLSKTTLFDLPRHKTDAPLSNKKQKTKPKQSFGHAPSEASREVHQAQVAASSKIKTELSPGLQDLIDQMEHYVTIESHKGISTLEMKLNLANQDSLFQGTLLTIEHYDTHPHSFNIQLSHSSQMALDELTAHLPTLLKSLETKLEHFQIHLLPPNYPKFSESKKVRAFAKASKQEKEKTPKTKEIPS